MSPRWRCPAYCGVRRASNGESRAVRHVAQVPACCAATALHRYLRERAKDQERTKVSYWLIWVGTPHSQRQQNKKGRPISRPPFVVGSTQVSVMWRGGRFATLVGRGDILAFHILLRDEGVEHRHHEQREDGADHDAGED